MHHQMGVRQARVDFPDAVDRQDVAGRLPRELVGAVTCPDRNGERVHSRRRDEVRRLIGIGQQIVMAEGAFGARSVLLARLSRLE